MTVLCLEAGTAGEPALDGAGQSYQSQAAVQPCAEGMQIHNTASLLKSTRCNLLLAC